MDWALLDEEVKSVPADYREVRFYPLKHVVDLFGAADPQALTAEVGWSEGGGCASGGLWGGVWGKLGKDARGTWGGPFGGHAGEGCCRRRGAPREGGGSD